VAIKDLTKGATTVEDSLKIPADIAAGECVKPLNRSTVQRHFASLLLKLLAFCLSSSRPRTRNSGYRLRTCVVALLSIALSVCRSARDVQRGIKAFFLLFGATLWGEMRTGMCCGGGGIAKHPARSGPRAPTLLSCSTT
jgi:hypothetical protein